MKQQNKINKGFTIIEVVLVLAIAGLIFLMIFIGLPALQRNQRDTQRRDDVGRFMSQLEQFRTNNRGAAPTVVQADTNPMGAFIDRYLDGGRDFRDPSTDAVYVQRDTQGTVNNAGDYFYATGMRCDGENAVAGNARQAAIIMRLEGSGVYCQSN